MASTDGRVRVSGVRLFYRSFGRPEKGTVLALHGGNGVTHDYLMPLADLVQFGYRVVLYDQVGCGRSDRPRGRRYYTHARAVTEVEGVRRALGLGRVHLFGHSYGGALALDAALAYPNRWTSLIVASGLANRALFASEQARLFAQLPREIRDTLTKSRAGGDPTDPRYLEAYEVWWRRHGCRLRVWPYEACRLSELGSDYAAHVPYGMMEERLQGWNITDRLPEIRLPCLLTAGQYDTITPTCLRPLHRGIRGSKLVVFQGCSHMAMWEDRVRFVEVLRDFLGTVTTR